MKGYFSNTHHESLYKNYSMHHLLTFFRLIFTHCDTESLSSGFFDCSILYSRLGTLLTMTMAYSSVTVCSSLLLYKNPAFLFSIIVPIIIRIRKLFSSNHHIFPRYQTFLPQNVLQNDTRYPNVQIIANRIKCEPSRHDTITSVLK